MIEPRRRIPARVVSDDRAFRDRVCAALARSARFRFEVGEAASRGVAVVDERSAPWLGAASPRWIVVRARPEAHPPLLLSLAERAAAHARRCGGLSPGVDIVSCESQLLEATSANRTRDLLFTRQLLYRLS